MKSKLFMLGLALVLSALIVACGPTTAQPTALPPATAPATPPVELPTATPSGGNAGMPNPAAVYCEQQGYTSEIRTAADGSQYGVCIFPDGSECDEWAFYRGECGPGTAVPATPSGGDVGIPNPAAVYCGQQGYTSEIRTAADGSQYGVCLFPDGSECDEWAFYRGECSPAGEAEGEGQPVEGWIGTVVKLPPGNQFGRYFERDDGQRYDIGSADANLEQQIAGACWTGAQVQVWGQLFTGVPAIEARHIEVERLEIVSGSAEEPRNLTPFATATASSFLPTDQGGQYQPWMAMDGLLETAWAEGVAGPGMGEWLTLTFPGTIEVHSVRVDVGYDRDAGIFAENNRVKRATFVFSSGEQVQLDFSDARGRQEIPLVRAPGPNIETTYVQVVIDEVYPGTRYDDTCLGEIEVWGTTQ